jgi:hypothetical protein
LRAANVFGETVGVAYVEPARLEDASRVILNSESVFGRSVGGAGNGEGAADASVVGVASSETLDRAEDRLDPNAFFGPSSRIAMPTPEGIAAPDKTRASNLFGAGSAASALHSRT